MKSMTTLRSPTFLSALMATLLGCGSSPQDDPPIILPTPDDGLMQPDQSADMSVECGALPERMEAFAGERLSLKAPEGAELVAVKWSAAQNWVEAPDQWWARAPYPAQEEVLELELVLTCAAGVQRHKLPLTISPLGWRHITWEQGQGPQAREHAPLWIGQDEALYMYGGYGFKPMQFTTLKELWRMDRDTGQWTELTLDPQAAPEGAGGRIVSANGARYYIGGDDATTGALNQALFKLTLEGDQGSWEQLPGGALHTSLSAIIWDEPRTRLLTTTGLTLDSGDYAFIEHLKARPCCGEGDWETIRPQGQAPSLRYGAFYGHDPQTQQLIISMGAQTPSANDPVNAAQDTWSLDLQTDTWRKLNTSGDQPPGRRNGCGFYDAKTQRLFVFGGTANARTAEAGLYILHLDGEQARWERVEPPAAARPRSSCSGVFDPERGEGFLGFGNSELGLFEDVHVLKLR